MPMEKDKAYNTVKKLFEAGSIDSFDEIVNIVGKTNIAKALGMHYDTFNDRMKHPDEFSVKHLLKLASLIGVDGRIIANLIITKLEKSRKSKSIN
jgi:hypothetical protein